MFLLRLVHPVLQLLQTPQLRLRFPAAQVVRFLGDLFHAETVLFKHRTLLPQVVPERGELDLRVFRPVQALAQVEFFLFQFGQDASAHRSGLQFVPRLPQPVDRLLGADLFLRADGDVLQLVRQNGVFALRQIGLPEEKSS